MPSRLRKLGLGLVVAAVLFGGVELGARLFLGAPTPPAVSRVPKIEGRWLKDDGAYVRTTYQESFAIGPIVKETERPRLIVLGGSSMHGGDGQLEAGMEAASVLGHAMDIDSVNLATPGMATEHLVSLLPEALALRPDAVLIYSGHNDIGNALFAGSFGDPKGRAIARGRHLLSHLRLFEVLEAQLTQVRSEAGVHTDDTPDAPLDADRRRAILVDYELRLRWLVRGIRDAGLPVILSTVASDAAAPPQRWSCPEVHQELGFRAHPRMVAGQGLPEELLPDHPCSDVQWVRAHQLRAEGQDEAAAEAFDRARDTDAWAIRAGRPTNAIIREVAEEEGAILVDYSARLRAEGRGWEPGPYFSDPLHLSDLGHRALAVLVSEELAPIFGLPDPGIEFPAAP